MPHSRWGASFNNIQKQNVYLRQQGTCADCGEVLVAGWRGSPQQMYWAIRHGEIHHILPLSQGGKHRYDNFVLLCSRCHLARHGKKAKKNQKSLDKVTPIVIDCM